MIENMINVYPSTVHKGTTIAHVTGKCREVYGYFKDELEARAWSLRQQQAYSGPNPRVVE